MITKFDTGGAFSTGSDKSGSGLLILASLAIFALGTYMFVIKPEMDKKNESK